MNLNLFPHIAIKIHESNDRFAHYPNANKSIVFTQLDSAHLVSFGGFFLDLAFFAFLFVLFDLL